MSNDVEKQLERIKERLDQLEMLDLQIKREIEELQVRIDRIEDIQSQIDEP